jgi:hypothetical protein
MVPLQLSWALGRSHNLLAMTESLSGLRPAVQELVDYANDVRRASHHTITNAVQRYVTRMDAEPVGQVAQSILPTVDFDAQYDTARGTIGSMVGSGQLDP